MSASDIREKLAANVQTSDVAKNMAIAKTKKMGEGFLNESIRPEIVSVERPEVKPEVKPNEKPIETPNTKDFVLKPFNSSEKAHNSALLRETESILIESVFQHKLFTETRSFIIG
jgi:hypothetical protein